MSRIKALFVAAAIMLSSFVLPVRAAGIQLVYDGANHLYTGSIYRLYVNGREIKAAMEPIIFNGHALVPVREIFEECGATVEYVAENREVEILYGDTDIVMHINDNCAYVNGSKMTIPDDVVPKLINKPGGLTKTMVPVRFIGETAGMDVDFDGENGAILLTAEIIPPEPTEKPVGITEIEYTLKNETNLEAVVYCDGDIEGKYKYFSLKAPERIVVDFIGMGFDNAKSSIPIGGNGITAIRTGVDSERTRVVIDIENLVSYTVKAFGKNAVRINVTVSGEDAPTPTPMPVRRIPAQSTGDTSVKNITGLTTASTADSKKTIMLDAGHGGSDTGAVGELDGELIYEKDLTLAITYKVKAILEQYGYKTSMTRTGDTLPSLSARPAQANRENCALFVSIHINAAASLEAQGTEVYWSEENNEDTYGVTSKQFADKVYAGMVKYMDSAERGVRMANWAVTRRANMPAILVEVGFISNEDELRLMASNAYQNMTAKGIAEGIINTIHSVEVP